jgi:hypothetical protein
VTFDESDLAAIDAAEEIEIETRAPGGELHRTIIWPVVSDAAVLVRSVNGAGARWYREARADPDVAIHLDDRRIPARAIPADDPESVRSCSAALRAKYRGDPSLATMVRPEIFATTLRLEPA